MPLNDMRNFPTIRVEMDGVRYEVIHAFLGQLDEIKNYAEKAIDASFNALQQGGLEKLIVETVQVVMKDAIQKSIKEVVEDAVHDYFEDGRGSEFIARAITSYFDGKD
jgi:hypothetical protein